MDSSKDCDDTWVFDDSVYPDEYPTTASVPIEFVKWFRGPSDSEHPKDKPKNYERIGYLVACNGGSFEVRSFGVMAFDGGPFKAGLTQEEGLELMQISSFINGANLINKAIFPYVMSVIKEWVEKTLAEHDKKYSQNSGAGENG